jgi:hypothetical protein
MQRTEIDILTIKTIIFERLLMYFKSGYYHQMKVIKHGVLVKKLASAANTKERVMLEKMIKDNEKYYNERYDKTLKYNSEVSNDIIEANVHKEVDSFIEESSDLFGDFTTMLMEVADGSSEIKAKTVHAALLETVGSDYSGGDFIVIAGNKYRIHLDDELKSLSCGLITAC